MSRGQTIDKNRPVPSALSTSWGLASAGSVHLDALRGAAALLVFLNHTRALYFSSVLDQTSAPPGDGLQIQTVANAAVLAGASSQPTANMFLLGNGGEVKLAGEAVVIFFVLSGYLVGGSVLRAMKLGRWSWRDYLIKRLTRLWVPLLPCLLICVCLDRIGYHAFGMGSIYQNPPGLELYTAYDLVHRIGIRVFLGNLFFLQGIAVPHLGTDVSLWSLANEFWYYLAFPCAALAVAPRSRLSAWSRVLYGFLAVAILLFTGKAIAVLFPIWLLGAAIAVLPGIISERSASSFSLIAFLLLLVCMLGVRFLRVSSLPAEYLIAFSAGAFLYFAIRQKKLSGDTIYARVSAYFSKVSYTLYIVHLPVAIFLASSINSPWRRWAKTPENLLLFFAMELTVLVCATLLWRMFEANTDAVRRVLFERSNLQKAKQIAEI